MSDYQIIAEIRQTYGVRILELQSELSAVTAERDAWKYNALLAGEKSAPVGPYRFYRFTAEEFNQWIRGVGMT